MSARLVGVLRRGRIVGPALAGGALVALPLPPFGLWVLGPPGAALLWWRIGGLTWERRLLAGWVFGLGCYVVGLWWVLSFNVYGGVLLFLMQALAPGLAAAVSPPGRGRLAVLAGAMVLVEQVRSTWPYGGLPLGGAALGQVGGPLGDVARIGGPRLLVGLVWLAGGGLGALAVTGVRVLRRRRLERRDPAGWRALTGAPAPAGVRRLDPVPILGPVLAGVVALVSVAALAALGSVAADGGPATGTVRVAAVQGGGRRGFSKEQVDPATVFQAQVTATQELVVRRGAAPALVLWPEDVVALNEPLTGSAAEADLAALALSLRATLLAGVTEPAGPGHFRNEIVVLSPTGRLTARFDKVHRVPFGEFVPLRGFVRRFADLSAVPEDAVAGHGDGVLHTAAGPVGTMVSYEVFFADRGRIATRAGATLLVVPTNTASYSASQVPTQEIAAARLQALSEGRDLVQAAPTGFSALIDHDGMVLARSDLGRRALVVGTVSLRTGRTLYERAGDVPVLVAAGAGVVGGWALALTGPSAVPLRRRWGRH
jgi:apolipoprotein N-acyltransferase